MHHCALLFWPVYGQHNTWANIMRCNLYFIVILDNTLTQVSLIMVYAGLGTQSQKLHQRESCKFQKLVEFTKSPLVSYKKLNRCCNVNFPWFFKGVGDDQLMWTAYWWLLLFCQCAWLLQFTYMHIIIIPCSMANYFCWNIAFGRAFFETHSEEESKKIYDQRQGPLFGSRRRRVFCQHAWERVQRLLVRLSLKDNHMLDS